MIKNNFFLTEPLAPVLPLRVPEEAYYPKLDGLRGIAVFLVLLDHWWLNKGFIDPLHLGEIGVGLFFILSGFLIGKILMSERIKAEVDNSTSKGQILKVFFIRRSLRIFPIYYLFLIILTICSFPDFMDKEYFVWSFAYLSNIKIFIFQNAYWPLGHFWSLSIEEQFYLLIPFLILYLPFKSIRWIIFSLIGIGFASRIALYLFASNEYYPFFTTCSFHFLGLGMFLAYLTLTGIKMKHTTLLTGLFIAIFLYLTYPAGMFTGRTLLQVALQLKAFILCLIVYTAIQTPSGPSLLALPPLRFLGKISYGIYLFHAIVPYVREYVIVLDNNFLSFSIDLFLTICLAQLSFLLIETPVSKFKKRYK